MFQGWYSWVIKTVMLKVHSGLLLLISCVSKTNLQGLKHLLLLCIRATIIKYNKKRKQINERGHNAML